MHGHNFQIIARSPQNTAYDSKIHTVPNTPIRRDTVQVMAGGYLIIRFITNNPDKSSLLQITSLKLISLSRVNLFHCHIEWHVEAGLVATLVEAPDKLQQQLTIPHDHLQICEAQGIPTKGNAAGNTKDYLNLTGAVTKFDTDPWGALVTKPKRIVRMAKEFVA